MTAILVILLVEQIVVSVVMIVLLLRFTSRVEENTQATENLRLNARTRISEVAVQSGPVTHEQEMRRLGRLTQGKRVVVGGEDSSQLHKDLQSKGYDV